MRPRVLIIDDDEICLSLERCLFEAAGAKVTTCSSGSEGILTLSVRQCMNEHFDLMCLDIRMPGVNGYEVARHSKSAGYRGPIVIFTADTSDEGMQRSQLSGADAYFNKTALTLEAVQDLLSRFCPDYKASEAAPHS